MFGLLIESNFRQKIHKYHSAEALFYTFLIFIFFLLVQYIYEVVYLCKGKKSTVKIQICPLDSDIIHVYSFVRTLNRRNLFKSDLKDRQINPLVLFNLHFSPWKDHPWHFEEFFRLSTCFLLPCKETIRKNLDGVKKKVTNEKRNDICIVKGAYNRINSYCRVHENP